jgi:hypothetical protein
MEIPMQTFLVYLALFAASLFSDFPSEARELGYRVGLSAIHVEPEIGIPLAGYGDKRRRLPVWDFTNRYPHAFFFKPSTGVRDPIRSKVMVVENSGKRLIFVSVDVIGVTKSFVDALRKRLQHRQVGIEELIVTGTHTHSGPGTLSKNIALNAIAVDLYQERNFQAMVDRTVTAIESAFQNLEEVDLYFTSFQAKDIQINKFRRAGKDWFNNTAGFILAQSKKTGAWLGGLLNFAMHGNAMPIDDLRYSADMPGALERAVQTVLAEANSKKNCGEPVVLFMNGAEGDVRHKGDRGEQIMEDVAKNFENQFRASFVPEHLERMPDELSVERKKVFLGVPGWPLKICAKRDGFYKSWMEILGRSGKIPMFGIFPTHTHLSLVKLGGVMMMSWPGEASTSLGFDLNRIASTYGFDRSWVLGLTNDYLTYFTTEHEFLEATYDSCSSLYTDKGGRRIIAHYRNRIEAMKQ